jgi:anthranilate/para-aminobenzoate synthase component II
MKILVVDNVTIGMHSLMEALKGYPHDRISYRQITPAILNRYDKVILSGGHGFGVLHPNSKYKRELDAVKKSRKPILGVCLGFQLICRAYGAELGDIKRYEKGVLVVRKVGADPLLKGLPASFKVYENHRHIVKKVDGKLVELAVSKDGIEMVRHRTKPMWGTQFHPEKFVKRTIGRRVLYNFLELKP